MRSRYLAIISLSIIVVLGTGCSSLKMLTNTFDDSQLLESESAMIFTKNNLQVFAYKKSGQGADEYPIGNLTWKSKVPVGRYRLAVSYDNPQVGKSFIPVSLSLNAQQGKRYWITYEESYGLLSNSWRPAIVENEPRGFYGILEFWKKK